MSAAQFKLDMFEGPLDLLLHLISKHKLNIYDIEISLLLEQYMDYINDLDHEMRMPLIFLKWRHALYT